jgi:hypothetical protein
MTDTEIKNKLMREARQRGICAEGYGFMRGCDRDQLVDYYVANPDWCMEQMFPSLDFLHSEFSDCEDKGVFVGRTFNGEVFGEKQVYIFHNCKGTIKVAMDYDNAVIPMLYFANGCNMAISCDQPNNPPIKVPLYVTDEGNNSIDYVVADNCEFIQHIIKLLDV